MRHFCLGIFVLFVMGSPCYGGFNNGPSMLSPFHPLNRMISPNPITTQGVNPNSPATWALLMDRQNTSGAPAPKLDAWIDPKTVASPMSGEFVVTNRTDILKLISAILNDPKQLNIDSDAPGDPGTFYFRTDLYFKTLAGFEVTQVKGLKTSWQAGTIRSWIRHDQFLFFTYTDCTDSATVASTTITDEAVYKWPTRDWNKGKLSKELREQQHTRNSSGIRSGLSIQRIPQSKASQIEYELFRIYYEPPALFKDASCLSAIRDTLNQVVGSKTVVDVKTVDTSYKTLEHFDFKTHTKIGHDRFYTFVFQDSRGNRDWKSFKCPLIQSEWEN